MTQVERIAPRVLPWLPSLIALVVTRVAQPYFGNMDDSNYVTRAGTTDPFTFAYQLFDPENGFLRFASWIVIWPASWLGHHLGPAAYFSANVAVVSLCLAAFGYAYIRAVGWTSPWLFPVFMGVAFTWPYTAELLFFPSLQEKSVILGAALLLLWIASLAKHTRVWIQISLLLAVTAFAFTTKTQILLLVPGAITALWLAPSTLARPHVQRLRVLATVLWVSCSIALVIIAQRGNYSSGTQGEVGFDFLQDRRFQLIALITLSYTVLVAWRILRRRFKSTDVIPLVFLGSACAVFPIWDIRNYYLAVVAVGMATAVTTVVSWFPGMRVAALAAVVATLVAAAWLPYRLPHVYASLASVRQFLESTEAQQLSAAQATILVSCEEAPTHYNRYAERFDVSGLDFLPASTDNGGVEGANVYVFSDLRLCPWPAGVNPNGWQVVWTASAESEAFVLYGRDAP